MYSADGKPSASQRGIKHWEQFTASTLYQAHDARMYKVCTRMTVYSLRLPACLCCYACVYTSTNLKCGHKSACMNIYDVFIAHTR